MRGRWQSVGLLAAIVAASSLSVSDAFGMGGLARFLATSSRGHASITSRGMHRAMVDPVLKSNDMAKCPTLPNRSATRRSSCVMTNQNLASKCAAVSAAAIAAFSLCIGSFVLPVEAESVRALTNSPPGNTAPADTVHREAPQTIRKIVEKIQLFGEILNDIQFGYVEPVDLDQLSEKAFSAMLSSLDPYTEFENPKAADQFATATFGNYAGVGLVVGKTKNIQGAVEPYVDVIKAMEGYSYDAGLRVGDRILDICEASGPCQSTKTLELAEVRNLLKGKAGSKVLMHYQRNGIPATQVATVTRKEVLLRDVPMATLLGDPREGIAYVKLKGFSGMAPIELTYVIQRLQETTDLRALVLDMRGNPGGLLSSAVQISNLFLPEGSEVVTTKGRALKAQTSASVTSGFTTTYSAKKGAEMGHRLPQDMRLVVLVDEGTASAAEIVSGAIQDHDRGVIIGQRTYGKGLVQQVDSLSGGSLLKYTAGKYYTPSGRCIQSRVYKEAGEGQLGTQESKVNEADRKVFFTDAGRPVKDAGGIEPDIVIPKAAKSSGLLKKKLEDVGAYYHFAGLWEAKHIAEAEQLIRSREPLITDEVYAEFQKWVLANVPTLEAPFDPSLNMLVDALKETGYEQAIPQVQTLKASLQGLLKKEFQTDAPALKRRLEAAIRDRFIPESLNLAYELNYDEEVHLALDMARNEARYLAIVSPDRNGAPGAGSTRLAASQSDGN